MSEQAQRAYYCGSMELPGADRSLSASRFLGASLDSATLQSVEGLLKLLAVFVALITFLGTPAVIVQLIRFQVPLQFMTRDQALRAGILPAISLIFLGLSMRWALSNPRRLLERFENLRYGGPLAARAGMEGVAVTNTSKWLTATTVMFLFLTPTAAGWNYSLHYLFPHLPGVIRGEGTWGSVQRTMWFVAVLFTAVMIFLIGRLIAPRLLRRAVKLWIVMVLATIVGEVISYLDKVANRVRNPLLQGAVFALILSGLFSAYLLLQKLVYGGQPWLRVGFWGVLLEGIAYGCLVTFVAVLAGALTQLAEPSTEREGRATAYGAILIIYFPLVALYASQWYPHIPYALGGGKPTQVSVWLESKSPPESIRQILGCVKDGELTMCEKTYLVHEDSERTILANSNDARTGQTSVVLSKDSVKAISGRSSF